MLKALTIFSGNANRDLAQAICSYVDTPLGKADVTRFADGEVYVEIRENVRGINCFVVQPTCSQVNDGWPLATQAVQRPHTKATTESRMPAALS